MPGIFETGEEVERAKEEMKEQLGEELENITLKYGKQTTAKALRKFYADFSANRVINSYPIPDEQYEKLLEMTDSRSISIAGRSKAEVVEATKDWYEKISDEQKEALWQLQHEFGDAVIYAYIDLTFRDLFVEERDEYVETATTAILELINNE